MEPGGEDKRAQGVWQSLHRQEEPGMEMKLTTDQLCSRARYRERENIWGRWFAAAACVAFGARFVYQAITAEQLSIRVADGWLALLMAVAACGVMRHWARRIEPGESCAQFMVRELEGSRQTQLALRWGILLALPSVLMMRLSGPAKPLSGLAGILLVFVAVWMWLGVDATKRARQAEELRNSIEGRE